MADVWPTSARRTDIRRPDVGVRRGNVQFDVVPTEALRRPDVGTTNTKIEIHRGPTSALRRLAYGEKYVIAYNMGARSYGQGGALAPPGIL